MRKIGIPEIEDIATGAALLGAGGGGDPYVGKLCFFRVYSGTVEAGASVYNSVKSNSERMGRILQMHANHRMMR